MCVVVVCVCVVVCVRRRRVCLCVVRAALTSGDVAAVPPVLARRCRALRAAITPGRRFRGRKTLDSARTVILWRIRSLMRPRIRVLWIGARTFQSFSQSAKTRARRR